MSSLAQSSHSAKSETVLRLLRLWHKPHTKAIYSDVIVCELKIEPSFWAALCDRSPSCKWIALSLSLPLPLSPTSISFPKLVPSYKLIASVNSWKNSILVSVQASEKNVHGQTSQKMTCCCYWDLSNAWVMKQDFL